MSVASCYGSFVFWTISSQNILSGFLGEEVLLYWLTASALSQWFSNSLLPYQLVFQETPVCWLGFCSWHKTLVRLQFDLTELSFPSKTLWTSWAKLNCGQAVYRESLPTIFELPQWGRPDQFLRNPNLEEFENHCPKQRPECCCSLSYTLRKQIRSYFDKPSLFATLQPTWVTASGKYLSLWTTEIMEIQTPPVVERAWA